MGTPRIPVHLYCSAVDMKQLLAICKMYNLIILEDAAQCHGALWNDQALGSIGHAGVFSFHEKKLLPCGEGGCIVTNDEEIYFKLYELRDHGARAPNCSSNRQPITSGNNRMSSYQAKLLSSRLKNLKNILEAEAENAEQLKSNLINIEKIRPLESPSDVALQTYYSFCWRVQSIDREDFLKKIRINTGVEWVTPYLPLSIDFNNFCSRHPRGKMLNALNLDFDAPVAERAWISEGVRFHHSILLSTQNQIVRFGEMIRKTVEECYQSKTDSL